MRKSAWESLSVRTCMPALCSVENEFLTKLFDTINLYNRKNGHNPPSRKLGHIHKKKWYSGDGLHDSVVRISEHRSEWLKHYLHYMS